MSAESPAPTEEKKQEKSPTPVFGSSSTFGTATGFAGFSPEAAASKAPAEDGGADQQHEEEECQATFKPVVELDEVETTTGEEMETQLLEMKCKLYRYDPDASEWKERGVGHVRLLENKDNKKIRLLMRQEKTLKIRANHIGSGIPPPPPIEEILAATEDRAFFSYADVIAAGIQRCLWEVPRLGATSATIFARAQKSLYPVWNSLRRILSP